MCNTQLNATVEEDIVVLGGGGGHSGGRNKDATPKLGGVEGGGW